MEILTETHNENKSLNLIKRKYKLFKVLILVHTETLKNYGNIVNNIKNEVKQTCVLQLPMGAGQTNTVSALIKNAITEDVGLIVNFCDEYVLSSALSVKGGVKLITYLTEPNLNIVTLNSDYLVVNFSLIKTCSNKNMANCYGQLCSFLFYLMEQVFNKAVFNLNVDNNLLLQIENCMQSLILVTPSVLKTEVGKTILTNICLKLGSVINNVNYKNSFVFTLSNLLIQTSKYKTLASGESLIIASTLSFKMFKVLLSAGMLTSEVGFNSYNRMKNIKQCFKQFSLTEISSSFMCDSNLNNHISNFFKIKTSFNIVFNLYHSMFGKMLNIFKGLYLDRGVGLNKYLSEQALLKAVNLLPEQFNTASLATFIRDCGLFNRI